MSTSTRWWAPQRATLEPDAVVRHLLEEPGALATTLLAAHRAGAAAIETVAKGPVPSEEGLVRAMATARAVFAEPTVAAVSKSMEPNYATLLVRDVLADAEEGALSLYRSAVSKGVSPPIAASRAAAVYGVPAQAMGQYAALAIDPRANPVALADAADRALLGYVARVCKEEDPGELVTVSKAPAGHAREYADTSEGWDEREHPRDPTTGQFVHAPPQVGPPVREEREEVPRPSVGSLAWVRQQLGLAPSSAPTRVAEEVTAPAPPAPAPARGRAPRGKQARGRQAQLTPTGRTAGPKLKRKQQGARLTRLERQSMLRNINSSRLTERLEKSSRAGEVEIEHTPDLLKDFGPSREGQYYELSRTVALAAEGAVMNDLRRRMAQQSDGFARPYERIFRLGHLLEAGASLPDYAGHGEHQQHLTDAADTAHATAETSGPVPISPEVDHVHPEEELNATPDEISRMLRQRQHEMATETKVIGGQERQVVNHQELEHTYVLPEYTPYNKTEYDDMGRPIESHGHAIVHVPMSNPKDPDDRAMPTVDEVIIVGAQGRTEGTARHEQVVLDPNQAYRVGTAPGTGGQPYEMFWDSEAEVFVRRWFLEPLAEEEVDEIRGGRDVGKALEPAQAAVFEQLHPRDTEGRFAEKEETVAPAAPAPAAPRLPRGRQARGRQARGRQTPLPAAAGRPGLQRKTATRLTRKAAVGQTLLARAESRLRARRGHQAQLPELDDNQDYKLLTDLGWEHLTQYVSDADLQDLADGGELTLNSLARRMLAEGTPLRSGQLAPEMAMHTQNDLKDSESYLLKMVPMGSVLDDQALAETIDGLFDEHPEVDIIEIVQHGPRVYFHGNKSPAREQNIIQMEQHIDWDKPVYLTYGGTYRARDLASVGPDGHRTPLVDVAEILGPEAPEGAIANPQLHVYRVTSSRTRLYRASND